MIDCLPRRLWRKIEASPHGCWLWTACVNADGYGRVYAFGEGRYAHAAIYQHLVGPIPAGLVVDHICRIRRCVNPDHLRIITRSENATENSLCPTAVNKQKVTADCGHPFSTRSYMYYGKRIDARYCKSCTAERDRQRMRQRNKRLVGT